MMDDVIRDLAKSHGRDDLTDAQVKEVKATLSNAYVDDILDSSAKPTEESTDGGSDGKA